MLNRSAEPLPGGLRPGWALLTCWPTPAAARCDSGLVLAGAWRRPNPTTAHRCRRRRCRPGGLRPGWALLTCWPTPAAARCDSGLVLAGAWRRPLGPPAEGSAWVTRPPGTRLTGHRLSGQGGHRHCTPWATVAAAVGRRGPTRTPGRGLCLGDQATRYTADWPPVVRPGRASALPQAALFHEQFVRGAHRRGRGSYAAPRPPARPPLAALFSGHAQAYQALSAQAALFHEQFVRGAHRRGRGSYAAPRPPARPPLAPLRHGRYCRWRLLHSDRRPGPVGAGAGSAAPWRWEAVRFSERRFPGFRHFGMAGIAGGGCCIATADLVQWAPELARLHPGERPDSRG